MLSPPNSRLRAEESEDEEKTEKQVMKEKMYGERKRPREKAARSERSTPASSNSHENAQRSFGLF